MENSRQIGMIGRLLFSSGLLTTPQQEPTDKKYLGQGIYLVYLNDAQLQYGQLYKGDQKLSEEVFRVGGLGGSFKNGYCSLLHYPDLQVYEDSITGLSCIVDQQGRIVLEAERYHYIYLLKGVLATMDQVVYNLLTGEAIVKYTQTIQGKNYLFAENSYNEGFPKGVYQIDCRTGTFQIFE